MKKNVPLIIWDCDGTIQTMSAFAYASHKRSDPGLSRDAFKAQNPGEIAMLPGMAEMIDYTDSKGYNNVLISEGDPSAGGCAQLLARKDRFKNWKFQGETVEWGCVPKQVDKVNIKLTNELVAEFEPSKVIVIGDSLREYAEALNCLVSMKQKFGPQAGSSVVFIKMGPPDETAEDVDDSHPPVYFVKSGMEMKPIIDKFLGSDAIRQALAKAADKPQPSHKIKKTGVDR